jgi:FMN-dependent NADH-azoreductase
MIMSQLLCLSSSPRGEASYSRRVPAHGPKELRLMHREAAVTARDPAREPLAQIDEAFVVDPRAAPDLAAA